MAMKGIHLLAILTAIVSVGLHIVIARDEDICSLFSNNTIIGDPNSCSQYITCIDFVSHYSTCEGSTPFFDKDNVKCVKSLSDYSNCTVSCFNMTNQFVADPKSCYGYYYCKDEETAHYGSCPTYTHFNETSQACIWQQESDCGSATIDYCSIIKNGVNFDNVESCEKYYSCKSGVLKSSSCSSQYYDAALGKCVSKSLVQCDAHPLPSNVCGKASSPKKNVFVSDGATCRGYFFCAQQADGTPDSNPQWGQCSENTFFDASTQTCRDPVTVKCTEDRCDGRTIDFVVAGTKGCRHYLRCVDGITASTLTCGNNFFDESIGTCVSNIISYTACNS